jgi:hypothetical protein
MNAMTRTTVLAICLLFAAGGAWGDPRNRAQPGNLQGTDAIVVSVDAAHSTVVMRVRAASPTPLAFTVSRSCLYTNGLVSLDDLFPNARVLVWTEGGQAGTLPIIVRVARAVN